MAEYTLVLEAQFSPTWCAGCLTHAGPFIDTHLEQMQINTAQGVMVFSGHVYFCTTCVHQMGDLAGCANPATYGELIGSRVALLEQIVRLEEELREARDNKVVNRDDFAEWLQNNVTGQDSAPVPAKRPKKKLDA